ncbi:hypothetical protein CGQ19_25830, partial [Klebsiella quasipneumoniae]
MALLEARLNHAEQEAGEAKRRRSSGAAHQRAE